MDRGWFSALGYEIMVAGIHQKLESEHGSFRQVASRGDVFAELAPKPQI
jgi:hypothetical protein